MNTPENFASRTIDSAQKSPHERLLEIVERHQKHTFKKPFQTHNLAAFEHFLTAREAHSNPEKIILDSCCGTGLSTQKLAENNPDTLVVGIDRSQHRLGKNNGEEAPNCLYLQTNCEDFWRLCVQNKISFQHHYILYPNPYPKKEHLQRRWHGHPVFVYLPQLSRKTTLRSNWQLYLEEFSLAWRYITHQHFDVKTIHVESPLTLFERKYHGSQQQLYEITVAS